MLSSHRRVELIGHWVCIWPMYIIICECDISPILLSRSLIFPFTFIPTVYLELVFAYGVDQVSFCLHMSIQLPQYYLLKISYSALSPLSKIRCSYSNILFLGLLFYPIDLFIYLMPVRCCFNYFMHILLDFLHAVIWQWIITVDFFLYNSCTSFSSFTNLYSTFFFLPYPAD